MIQILLVEDDHRISDFLVKGLEENGYVVHLCPSAEEAQEVILNATFDLIILDIMLPGIDGIQFTKMIRYRKNTTPILILSALNDTLDKVSALDNGADDFLVKPFHFQELISRINALTRRNKYAQHTFSENKINLEHVLIDYDKFEVYSNQKKIDFSPKEFKLLTYLIENRNKVVSRTQILQAVWGVNFDTNTNVVDVYISYIRTKLADNQQVKIQTVKGVGYMFLDEL